MLMSQVLYESANVVVAAVYVDKAYGGTTGGVPYTFALPAGLNAGDKVVLYGRQPSTGNSTFTLTGSGVALSLMNDSVSNFGSSKMRTYGGTIGEADIGGTVSVGGTVQSQSFFIVVAYRNVANIAFKTFTESPDGTQTTYSAPAFTKNAKHLGVLVIFICFTNAVTTAAISSPGTWTYHGLGAASTFMRFHPFSNLVDYNEGVITAGTFPTSATANTQLKNAVVLELLSA